MRHSQSHKAAMSYFILQDSEASGSLPDSAVLVHWTAHFLAQLCTASRPFEKHDDSGHVVMCSFSQRFIDQGLRCSLCCRVVKSLLLRPHLQCQLLLQTLPATLHENTQEHTQIDGQRIQNKINAQTDEKGIASMQSEEQEQID